MILCLVEVRQHSEICLIAAKLKYNSSLRHVIGSDGLTNYSEFIVTFVNDIHQFENQAQYCAKYIEMLESDLVHMT